MDTPTILLERCELLREPIVLDLRPTLRREGDHVLDRRQGQPDAGQFLPPGILGGPVFLTEARRRAIIEGVLRGALVDRVDPDPLFLTTRQRGRSPNERLAEVLLERRVGQNELTGTVLEYPSVDQPGQPVCDDLHGRVDARLGSDELGRLGDEASVTVQLRHLPVPIRTVDDSEDDLVADSAHIMAHLPVM